MSNYNPPPDEGAPTRPMNPIPTNPQGPYQQPYQQQGYQPAPYQQYQGAQPPKKGGALKWILIGCAGFLLIGTIVGGGLVYYGYNKAKQAGFDPGNPVFSAAKIAVMNSSDVEYVSSDESNNTITVKDKKTGKTVTLKIRQDQNGHIDFTTTDANGKETSMTINGDGKGSVDIKSSEGNVKIGGGASAKLPSWVPEYPGVDIQGTYSTDNSDSSGAGYSFTTEDSADEVIQFYEDHMKGEGFQITKTTSSQNGQTSMSITGNSKDYARTLFVSASVVDDETKVSVVTQTKK